ncbi:hypothetical protein HPP92_003303 [Vanilla planifolia]|uniref:Symplekin C-terminal domain-containing protein n=1 Tax=Vanilla planifolia TaxID=51239 RepID=A0A835VNI1_VANPL|nr:hypothetical protein HPP92_003303 [Vanilla planifolia]
MVVRISSGKDWDAWIHKVLLKQETQFNFVDAIDLTEMLASDISLKNHAPDIRLFEKVMVVDCVGVYYMEILEWRHRLMEALKVIDSEELGEQPVKHEKSSESQGIGTDGSVSMKEDKSSLQVSDEVHRELGLKRLPDEDSNNVSADGVFEKRIRQSPLAEGSNQVGPVLLHDERPSMPLNKMGTGPTTNLEHEETDVIMVEKAVTSSDLDDALKAASGTDASVASSLLSIEKTAPVLPPYGNDSEVTEGKIPGLESTIHLHETQELPEARHTFSNVKEPPLENAQCLGATLPVDISPSTSASYSVEALSPRAEVIDASEPPSTLSLISSAHDVLPKMFPLDLDPWDLLQKHVISDFLNHEGHELTLRVLYRLYREAEQDQDFLLSRTATSVYEMFLLNVAEALRDKFPASDKSLGRLLAEVPYLSEGVLNTLECLCSPQSKEKQERDFPGGDRITQGLSAVWSLILLRPSSRDRCLQIVLQSAVHHMEEVRMKAIRLVANKLFPMPNPPTGSENLLMQVLQTLTDGAVPSQDLISCVRTLYNSRMKDVEFLIPVLPFLSKDEIFPLMPQLVNLPMDKFQVALTRILQVQLSLVTPRALLKCFISIHGIDSEKDSVPLKKIMDACSACFELRPVFTQQVLASVLNQLVEQIPLPLLFMRTVIQAIGVFPGLVDFVMDILSRLVSKQIWKYPKLWVGFLKCALQTKPQSFKVLLQLPAAQLENALNKNPVLRPPLVEHANQPNIRSTLPRSTLVVLGLANDPQRSAQASQTSAQAQQTSQSQAADTASSNTDPATEVTQDCATAAVD